MAKPADSFRQFDYSLRPSKQVERKVMIEVLLKLAKAGYDISVYSYLGFGSVYYVDFVMFHKYLFIDKMFCVEWGDIEKRMRFNKPFKFIKLKLMPLATHIPSIRRMEHFLAWLDYDRSLDPEMLLDIDGVADRLAPKSIFVVTVDARPRLPKDQFDTESMSLVERERLTLTTYHSWFGRYLDTKIERDTDSNVHVAPMFYEVILERIRQTLAKRPDSVRFIQLFNYFYRDGAPMLTVGGMIGTEADQGSLEAAGVFSNRFVRTGSDYLHISVPPLTIREKHWLDCRLDANLTSARLQFELDEDLLKNYRDFYKQYPTYLEALL
jgi:hypothetical protein